MQRFNPGDPIFILPKFGHLYPTHSAVVVAVKPDPFRPIFNEYAVEFADGSAGSVFEFQVIEDLPNYITVIADVAFDSRQQMAKTQARGRMSGVQIILQARQFDVDMKIRIGKSRASVIGQVLERGTTNLLAHVQLRLMKESVPVATTTSDSAGVFLFIDVPRGSLNILALLTQHSMRILGSFSI